MMKILLIEDDKGISIALKQALATVYAVEVAAKGSIGLQLAMAGNYQCILLDLNLPDAQGLEICKQIRSGGVTTPIIVITADSAVLRKISLLDSGANDYITKPFSLGELKARIRVLERHLPSDRSLPQTLKVFDLEMDTSRHLVSRSGQSVKLRRKEFMLLECLMQNVGTVVTRQALMHYAWHGNQDPWTNTVDVHIKYLRDKIDRPFTVPLIQTVHGLGYKLEAPRGVAKIIKQGGIHERITTKDIN